MWGLASRDFDWIANGWLRGFGSEIFQIVAAMR